MRYSIVHHDVREEFDLTVSQYLVCDSIHQLSHGGPVKRSDTDIAAFLGLDRSHVGYTRKILIQRGLVLELPEGQMTSEKWSSAVTYKRGKSPRGENPAQNGEIPTSHLLYKEIKNGDVSEDGTSDDSIIPFQEEAVPKSRAKYTNARIAFSWLPNPQKSWDKDLTQLSCGELLFERGEEKVRGIVKFVRSHQEDDGFNWVFTKPSDYERKWEDMKAYAKRING